MEEIFVFTTDKKSTKGATYHGLHYDGYAYHESFYSATNAGSSKMTFRCENREKLSCHGGMKLRRRDYAVLGTRYYEAMLATR